MKISGIFYSLCLFSLILFPVHGQGRGSIPEILLRPAWGESSRYPVDIVIGELGQGRAQAAAFTYASSIAEGLLSGQMTHPSLVSINSALRENYLRSLANISPRSFRIGGGRQEPDGAVSFLVRFIGRDYGITGELYIKYLSGQIQEDEEETLPSSAAWVFDELLLDGPRSHDTVNQQTVNRLDKLPYERFY